MEPTVLVCIKQERPDSPVNTDDAVTAAAHGRASVKLEPPDTPPAQSPRQDGAEVPRTPPAQSPRHDGAEPSPSLQQDGAEAPAALITVKLERMDSPDATAWPGGHESDSEPDGAPYMPVKVEIEELSPPPALETSEAATAPAPPARRPAPRAPRTPRLPSVVECGRCGDEFRSPMALKIHTTKVHPGEPASTQPEQVQASRGGVVVNVDGVKALACATCGRAFPSRKRLREHSVNMHPTARTQSAPCDTCGKTFRTRAALRVHCRLVHAASLAVPCPECHKTFKTPMLLQKHREWSHPADGRQFPCELCPRVLHSQPSYAKHMEHVHPPEGARVTCEEPGCFKSFKSAHHQRQHRRRFHLGQRPTPPPAPPVPAPPAHLCPHCPRGYSSASALDWHLSLEHPRGPNSNACPLCERVLPDKSSLRRHVRGVHAAEAGCPGVACAICRKHFKSELSLQQHLRVTHAPPDAAVECHLCGRTLKCRAHLQVHINSVHTPHTETGEPHTCAACGKEFTSRRYLERHARLHAARTLACVACAKLFKTSEDLRRHQRRVHEPRTGPVIRYRCGECDKELGTVYTLRAHLSAVHGGGDGGGGGGECAVDECRLGFASVAALASHRRAHHPHYEPPPAPAPARPADLSALTTLPALAATADHDSHTQ